MANHDRPSRLVLVLGGARSGKSTFAEQLAVKSGRSVAFIATATAGDEEMRKRIAHHRATRPTQWQTIEEPVDIAAAVRRASEGAEVIILDCMTLWLANWMGAHQSPESDVEVSFSEQDEATLSSDLEEFLSVVTSLPLGKTLIVVSNEVGLGIVPAYPLGRVYRDMLGRVNQLLAYNADRVYLMIAGLAVDIKRLHEEATL